MREQRAGPGNGNSDGKLWPIHTASTFQPLLLLPLLLPGWLSWPLRSNISAAAARALMSAPACLQLTQVARIHHTLRMLNKQIEMETGHETEIEAQAWPKFTLTCIAVAVAPPPPSPPIGFSQRTQCWRTLRMINLSSMAGSSMLGGMGGGE